MTRLLMAMTADRADHVCDSETRELINTRFEPTWLADHDQLDADRLRALLPGHDVVITSWGTPPLPTELLGAAGGGPSVVAHAAGTIKRLVQPAAFDSGVTVFSAASRIAWSVGEFCLSAMLTLLRRLPEFDASIRRGEWKPTAHRGHELRGRRVAIIGASSTGRALIGMLAPFEPEIVVYDPYLSDERAAELGVRTVSLAEAMTAPVVSVHLPAIPETENLITAELISQLPDDAILINSSRAAAVDTDALITEARSGRIRVALDVFPSEPPTLDPETLACPNLLLTPHVAGDTIEGRRALVGYVLADVLEFQRTGRHGLSWVDPQSLPILA